MKPLLLTAQIIVVALLAVLSFFIFTLNQSILWTIGLLIGVLLLWIDETIGHTWYQDSTAPQAQSEFQAPPSQPFPSQPTQPQLITRSILFLLALLPLSFYVITSTASTLGWGLVMGLMSALSLELLWNRSSSEVLKTRYFAVSSKIPEQTLQWAPWAWAGITILLLILILL